MLYEELDYGDRVVIETTGGTSYDGSFYGTRRRNVLHGALKVSAVKVSTAR